MKILLILSAILYTLPVVAQNIFWAFNDAQEPLTIAPECAAQFEEIRGGVFMPTPDEVYQHGLAFLASSSDEVRRQAPYCFLAAALQGNVGAQFELAKLYNKGDILPQDDLSAYKWSFISALNGNRDAELFTLNLEQVLSTSDLEATGVAIERARQEIQNNMQRQMEAMKSQTKTVLTADNQPSDEAHAPLPTSTVNIFGEEDHF